MKTILTPSIAVLIALSLQWRICAEQGYNYPLKPGTSAWTSATPQDRITASTVPKSFTDTASSLQLFLSAVTNPYFRSILSGNTTMAAAYNAAKSSGPLVILFDAENTADFGFQAFSWLHGLQLSSISTTSCSTYNGTCWMDYCIVCYMAGNSRALQTIDSSSVQTLFRLAVWDANYFVGNSDYQIAAYDVNLMYALYGGGWNFGVTLPTLTADQSVQLSQGILPSDLIPTLSSIKSQLGLTSRP